MKRTLPLVRIGCLLPLPAAAQTADWEYSATLYGWFPGLDASVDTDYGELDSNTSGSDVLDNLDMAFMGTFEARHDRWGFLFDLLYADLSTSKDTPFGLLFEQGEVKTKMTALSAYALYRVYDTARLSLDLGLGVRGFKVDLDTSLSPGLAAGWSASADKSWALPLVAARFIAPIDENWFATASFDYGQTSGNVSSWQAVATVGYRFDEKWAMQVGYRFMDIQQEFGGRDADLQLSGPIIGVNMRF